ncbi:hypothetical protein HYPGJ_30538 [Hyphomicrobium sp. GJ21]|nr:hypothetical protein HYPGJ_30538 [Hyphomicrobium sp. GJ21]
MPFVSSSLVPIPLPAHTHAVIIGGLIIKGEAVPSLRSDNKEVF